MFAVTGPFPNEDYSPGTTSRLTTVMRTYLRGVFRSCKLFSGVVARVGPLVLSCRVSRTADVSCSSSRAMWCHMLCYDYLEVNWHQQNSWTRTSDWKDIQIRHSLNSRLRTPSIGGTPLWLFLGSSMDFMFGLLVSSLKLHFKSAGIITLDRCFHDTNLPKNVHYQKMLEQILQTRSQLI